jgi:hypothetical protein
MLHPGEIMRLVALCFSAICFLTTSLMAHSSLEVVRESHLTTAEGRTAFLTQKLAPFMSKASELNNQVTALAKSIEALSPEKDQQKIILLTKEMTEKMAILTPMLPAVPLALSINADLLKIDSISQQGEPLTAEQAVVVDRLAKLCTLLQNVE